MSKVIATLLTIIVFGTAFSGGAALAEPDAQNICLNGAWEFCYTPHHQDIEYTWKEVTKYPHVPRESDFEISIEVPGYWDDYLDKMKNTSWWSNSRFNPRYKGPVKFPYEGPGAPAHPCAEFPYLLGAGWYRRTLSVPAAWQGRNVMLTVGGVRIDCYFYLNGSFIGSHKGCCTPAQIDLTSRLKYGQPNEIMLEVVNTTYKGSSCALRGYQGNSGGIYDDVKIHVSAGPGRINHLFLRPVNDMNEIRWSAELMASRGLDNKPTNLRWRIKTLEEKIIKNGSVDVMPLAAGELSQMVWDIPADGIKPWSIWDPQLYHLEIIWQDSKGLPLDRLQQSFGFRSVTHDNDKVYLNHRPIILRGICEIYSFSPDIHPQNSVEYFRNIIRSMQNVGYNHFRFHTWTPPQKYMQAADELGIILQIELPTRQPRTPFDYAQWRRIIKWSRTHPSVAIYCGGNEEICHEGMVAFFENLNTIAKQLDPGCLFMPMETMRGIVPDTYEVLKVPEQIKDPDLYHKTLFERTTNCSDIFAVRNAGTLSYNNFLGQGWRQREPYLELFERPVLAHELGIVGGYLDLRLENRYNRTIPPDIYSAARHNLERYGRLPMAQKYYENSALWQGAAHKYLMEKARKSEALDGYDHLGGWDPHWHRAGYGCGMLNDFLELKYGATAEKILQFNGESVVLLDNQRDFVFAAGQDFSYPVMLSLYGPRPLQKSTLNWQLTHGQNVLKKGSLPNLTAPNGRVTQLGKISFKMPELKKPAKVKLSISIDGYCCPLTNQWDLWLFPPKPAPPLNAVADDQCLSRLSPRYPDLKSISVNKDTLLRIVSQLTPEHLQHLAVGKDVLLLGADPFPHLPTRFQISCAGRVDNSNYATVIYDHPVFAAIPHDGFCDWQFFHLLENGTSTVFNELHIKFDPILEMVSSYKRIQLKASLWEARTEPGGGRLFVAGCNFDNLDDPATVALLDGIIKYLTGADFKPRTTISVAKVINPLLHDNIPNQDAATPDISSQEGYDPAAKINENAVK